MWFHHCRLNDIANVHILYINHKKTERMLVCFVLSHLNVRENGVLTISQPRSMQLLFMMCENMCM